MALKQAVRDKHRRARKARMVTPLFLLVMLSTFAYFVSVGALQPTLPLYVKGPLGGGDVAVGFAIGSFALAAVLIRPLVGPVGDRRGRRPLIVGGAATVALSVAAYTVAASPTSLLLLRLVSGAGEACFYVGAASVINDLAPDERRGEAFSYFSLALYGGLTLGPVLGEKVFEASTFDAAWIVAAASAAVAALLALPVTDTRPEGAHVPRRFRLVHPAGLLPGVVLATSIWGLGGFATFTPLYAQEVGLKGSRLVFVAFSAMVLAIRSLGARIPDILGPRRAAGAALTTSAIALTTMGVWQQPAGLFIGAALFGVGQALSFPALITMAVNSAPASERAAVIGTFTAFFDLGFGLGAVSLGAVAAALGYGSSFIAAALLALAGLALLLARARAGRSATSPA